MKKRFLSVAVALLLLLTSCKFNISIPEPEKSFEPGTKVTEFEFYAHKNPESYGFKASDDVGLTGVKSGVVTLESVAKKQFYHYGAAMTLSYKKTVVDDINDSQVLSEFNRGYDVYGFSGQSLEYWVLSGTGLICGYRNNFLDTSAPSEPLSSIGFKGCSDEFLYNIMPSGWRDEYSRYSFIKPQSPTDKAVAIYTREIAGYLSDDFLRVEMTPSGEVYYFEAFGRGKYDLLQNTVSNEDLSKAEALLDEFLSADEFGNYKKGAATVVTDKNGRLYLKKELTTEKDKYVDAFFVKISSNVLEMSDEYLEMVEENYKTNKALDNNPETTTKNRIINDQNGELIAKFRYGAFSADYNSAALLRCITPRCFWAILRSFPMLCMIFKQQRE